MAAFFTTKVGSDGRIETRIIPVNNIEHVEVVPATSSISFAMNNGSIIEVEISDEVEIGYRDQGSGKKMKSSHDDVVELLIDCL